jgi:hypothetical protein
VVLILLEAETKHSSRFQFSRLTLLLAGKHLHLEKKGGIIRKPRWVAAFSRKKEK